MSHLRPERGDEKPQLGEPLDNQVVERLINRAFSTTPLPFVQHFLRIHKKASSKIRIGTTVKECRDNLRDALISRLIGLTEFEQWLNSTEGWGKQHLYLGRANRRGIALRHLLTTGNLKRFLIHHALMREPDREVEPVAHMITEASADDEFVTVAWTSHLIDYDRHEELDEVRELLAGVVEFRAFLQIPRRSTARLVIRKTDGIVLRLVDVPLGENHDQALERIDSVAERLLSPIRLDDVPLAPLVTALDQGATERFGPGPKRRLDMQVAPTQAKFRTDGARVEFSSTRDASGYADSGTMRTVRRALVIAHFEGEAGKFRLDFSDDTGRAHRTVISLHASDNRTYLYSRMKEDEVFLLVDRLMGYYWALR